MSKHFELEYLADCIYVESILSRHSTITKTADGLLSSIGSQVKDYVFSLFDKNRPIASVLAFLGPGLLFSLNFPLLAVLYEAAEVFGFDWISFWESVKNNVQDFLRGVASSKQKPSEAQISDAINVSVKDAADASMGEEPSKSELESRIRQMKHKFPSSSDSSDADDLLSFASSESHIIKRSYGFKSKLISFFTRKIAWLIKTALISLGFAAGGGVVSSLMGTKKPSQNSEQDSQETSRQAIKPVSPIPQEIAETHRNDLSGAWIERASIDNIDDLLSNWIFSVYPQLSNSNIQSSQAFNSMISKFHARNRLASGLNMIAMPRPYQRKLDIVNEVVNGFLRSQ